MGSKTSLWQVEFACVSASRKPRPPREKRPKRNLPPDPHTHPAPTSARHSDSCGRPANSLFSKEQSRLGPQNPVPLDAALTQRLECHPHTVEVTGSNPVPPIRLSMSVCVRCTLSARYVPKVVFRGQRRCGHAIFASRNGAVRSGPSLSQAGQLTRMGPPLLMSRKPDDARMRRQLVRLPRPKEHASAKIMRPYFIPRIRLRNCGRGGCARFLTEQAGRG